MKRCAFGAVLLAALLVVSLAVSCLTDRFQEPVRRDLDRARQAALEEDWQAATFYSGQARTKWERGWRLLAAVADHAPMEEMDGLYAQLQVSLARCNTEAFAALCGELSCRTKAIADAHRGSWWNFL